MNWSLIRRVLLSVFMGIVALTSLILFIYSFFQMSSNEGSPPQTIDCNQEPYSNHRPLNFKPKGATSSLYCGWSSMNDSLRCVSSLAGFLYLWPLAFFGLWKKKKWLVWLNVGLSILMLIVIFSIMCIDANSIQKSKKYFKGSMEGATFDYSNYVYMTIADAGNVVAWFLLSVLGAWYATKFMHEDFVDWSFQFSDDEHKRIANDGFGASSAI